MPEQELNLDLLVRHPAPFPDESLYGYILRLSEANGYPTPWAIFRQADLADHPNRAASIRVEKLARITNRSETELGFLSYVPPVPDNPADAALHKRLRPTARLVMRLLGHNVRSQDIVDERPRICPDCVQEKGYIQAHWDLVYMIACPVHGRRALSRCPVCLKPLTWFRQGLLVCGCGAPLKAAADPLPQVELNVLDMVRRKVLRLGVDGHGDWGTIATELYSLDLRSLLAFIRILAKHQLSRSNRWGSRDAEPVVRAAANVLTDWPKNLHSLLKNIGEKTAAATKGGSARRQFNHIYRDLFLNWEIKPAPPEFAKRAFLDFVMNQWGYGTISPSLLRKSRDGLSKRFLTKTEMAQHLGVTDRTVTRLLTEQKIPYRLIKAGKRQYYLFDREELNLPAEQAGRVYSLRDAAAIIELPVDVLRELKRAGDYVSKHLPEKGFHSLDLRAFKEQLLALSPKAEIMFPSGAGKPSITLSNILRSHHIPCGGVATIRALLDRRLPVIGNADATISGLMISKRQFKAFADDSRALFAGNMRTPAEAAKELQCEPDTIAGLVNQGLLKGQQKPKGLRVSEASLSSFKQKYVSVASLAKQIQSSSRGVLGYCEGNAIPILYVQTKRKWKVQSFMRVEDTHRLRDFSARADRRKNEAMVRLPLSVLRPLEKSGHFEVKQMKNPRGNRFHHADVIAFANKLFGLTPSKSLVPAQDCITLEKAMQERYGSAEGKANLIRALLSTELPIVGNANGTIGGLLIPRAQFRELFRKQVESEVPGTGTNSLAAHTIGCDRRFIPALVELGLLRHERVGAELQISEESIVAFKKAYLAVADVAKPLGTSSARVIRHCRENGIKLLTVPSKVPKHPATSFMRVEDQQLVLSSFPKNRPSVRSGRGD